MNSPLVSIIIPSTSREERLVESIDSALSQDYSPIELLVAGNGSNGGMAERLAEKMGQDGRLKCVSLPGNEDAALADYALGQARGTIIGCLKPGDRYAPGAIGRAVEQLQANPDWLLVHGRGEYFDTASNLFDGYSAFLPEMPNGNDHAFCEAGVFFKRSLYVLLGKTQTGIPFGFHYWLKAFTRFSSRIGFVDAVLAYSCVYDEAARKAPIEVAAFHHWEETVAGEFETGIDDLPQAAAGPEKDSPIKPDELIKRYAIAEHIQFADDYFKGRESHLYLYQKPFFHPRDCAPSLSNLGQLFAGANLEQGMRVLDFASGSCWLSRILVQLGCIVTCCDASRIALDIGKELFRKYPPIADDFKMPDFHVFDGAHLDLPDRSFDRILVNDAFHHVPNTEAVLAEFFRILKDDGMVCMSEPGRFHSQTEASQYEMREFNVIENDFVLEDLWQEAQAVGFESVQICPVLRQSYLNMEDYLQCIRGRVPEKVVQGLIGDTVNHSIFFLHKSSSTDARHLITEHEKFDEAWYLSHHPDVEEAVSAGAFDSGWDHYRRHGGEEGRAAKKLAGR